MSSNPVMVSMIVYLIWSDAISWRVILMPRFCNVCVNNKLILVKLSMSLNSLFLLIAVNKRQLTTTSECITPSGVWSYVNCVLSNKVFCNSLNIILDMSCPSVEVYVQIPVICLVVMNSCFVYFLGCSCIR